MRTAGIIGGLGPESTIDYYRSIVARYQARTSGAESPHLVIDSLDVNKGVALLNAGRLSELADYLAGAIDLLARAGADFAALSANTPHLVFPEVQRRSPIPLISIVRATCAHAKSLGVKKPGLFGTGFTMRANFYTEEFQQSGMALVRPNDAEIELIHRIYIGELLKNQFLPESRAQLLNIAQRMRTDDGIDALVLAGTELPLLLRDSPPEGLELLDTTRIHVEAIVDELLR